MKMLYSRLSCAAALALLAGCANKSDKLPDLHPATGTITKNGQPVKDGSVRFMPADNADLIVSGDVDGNGRFELYTVKKSNRQKGAPAGTYSITYSPPNLDQRNLPITPTRSYTIEAKTNELAIELAEKK
jgi:hypothetical protein